ncbi:MAG: lytic murein transglycosylase [Candidatus Moranbacteria bacterium]|nr:lytic murein transglycosylase [Candidatus Moranbacteria bacterium]
MKNTKILLSTIFFLGVFALGQSLFFVAPVQAEESADELKKQAEKVEKKLKDAEKKYGIIESNLNQISSTLTATQQAILRVSNLLNQTTQTIDQKEIEIANLDQQLVIEKRILSNLLQELYLSDATPLVEVFLAQDDVRTFFQNEEGLLSTQEKISDIIGEISLTKEKLVGEKSSLEEVKQDHEELLALQSKQKQGLVAAKNEVAEDLEDQATTVKRLKSELSELQGDLNKILGKSYNAKDIEEAVEFASKKTGVPKGFLFGVLKMETNLGANVGGCTYAQVEDGAEKSYKAKKLGPKAWATFLRRRDTFKTITKELGIDYRKQKVSCNPRGYVGTGGAMGVAQFMPDTWVAYKGAVTSATGHNPPSPWNLTDGVMAMALKLDRVPGVDQGNRSAWKRAAAAYLGTSYAPYINGILYWADNYKKLL